jgi:nitrite reductase (NO-forming)
MEFVRWRSMAFGLVGAMALLLVSAACIDEPLQAFTQQLVPPPGVAASHELGNRRVIVNLESVEQDVEIAPGVKYTTWTFNGSVPGPIIRARVGDTVEVHLKNAASNVSAHNIDLHAVTGPGGGAGVTTVLPGEEKAFEFKATTPGLFVYHCAAGIVADHIANGMYGAILIEPAGGLPKVDHEFYIGQSEFYTPGDVGAPGEQPMDMDKLMQEDPTYVVFNGNTKSLIGDKALQAKVGETVRLYVANGGPNLISSFHVIGEIFDKAWAYGGLTSSPEVGVQTVLIPPGGAAIVEFKVDVPGDYKLVDHSVSRLSKGAVGTLHVEGPANPELFNSLSGVPAAQAGGHDMGTMTATATASTPAPTTAAPTATPTAAATSSGGAAGATAVAMKDNVFETTTLTAKLGQKVTYDVTNDGKVPHNMRIAAADGNYDSPESVVSVPEIISGGKKGTITWTPSKAGTYKFRCDLHPDQMTGTITVQ